MGVLKTTKKACKVKTVMKLWEVAIEEKQLMESEEEKWKL